MTKENVYKVFQEKDNGHLFITKIHLLEQQNMIKLGHSLLLKMKHLHLIYILYIQI